MKRKVNRVGQSTLTVSLPVTWVKEHHVQRGDELDVIETGQNLIFSKEYTPRTEQIFVDVSGQKTMITRIVGAAYKAGYDEVFFHYSNSDELKIIQSAIERCLAEFDIVEYKKDKVNVKAISKPVPEQFETVLRKIFFSLKDVGASIVSALSNRNTEELKSIAIRDKSIDRYADHCRRLLNKGVHTMLKRPHCAYSIIEELEIIGDMYKKLCCEVEEKKLKVSNELIDLLKEVNTFFSDFSQLMFDFSMEKVRAFGESRERLIKLFDKMYTRVGKKELKAFFLTNQIFDGTFEMKSALLTMQL